MFEKEIDKTRKKLSSKSSKLSKSIQSFLSDFINQIGHYISANDDIDSLLDSVNDHQYVVDVKNILNNVVKNQKRKKSEQFELSFSPSILQKHFSLKKENYVKMAAFLEIIITDLLQELYKNKKTINDIFTDDSSPLYDIFNATFTYFKTPKKSLRKRTSLKKTKRRISLRKSLRKTRKTSLRKSSSRKTRKRTSLRRKNSTKRSKSRLRLK